MTDRVFFYGTLMTGFERRQRAIREATLSYRGWGWIPAALFDLGIYPAAVPALDSRVWGEVYEMVDPAAVLAGLDQIEGYCPEQPEASLYTRVEATATLDRGGTEKVWVYFYNAPLGRADRITSGDYLQHLRLK